VARRAQKSIVGADETAINAYLAYLHARPGGIKSASQRRLMASLRRCYRWLLDQGRLQADPLLNIDKPATTQRFPKTLSEKQVEDLLGAPDMATPLGLRDRAMFELLYATGLRVSELVGIRLFELSLNDNVVRVMGKGSKERLVPLGESRRRLAAALPRRRPRRTAQAACVGRDLHHRARRRDDAADVLEPGQEIRAAGRHSGGSAFHRTCCATPSPPTC
jgi:integrase/recombinase XerD